MITTKVLATFDTTGSLPVLSDSKFELEAKSKPSAPTMSVNEPQILSSDSEDSGDEVESVEATKWKADLLRTLKAVKTFGNFSYMKQHELFANPGLEVAASLIPLPLVTRDAEKIKALSQQAPLGRGDETLVDTRVRKTWELNIEQFRCSNPRWKTYLDTLLQEAAKSLGMQVIHPYS